MKEEDKLLKKIGRENPFSVPGEYFENLTSEIMDRLPEKDDSIFVRKEVTLWNRMKPWVYMAAMFAGAALIVRVASTKSGGAESNELSAGAEVELISDEHLDYALNQAMFDDYSLYVYLSEANTDIY